VNTGGAPASHNTRGGQRERRETGHTRKHITRIRTPQHMTRQEQHHNITTHDTTRTTTQTTTPRTTPPHLTTIEGGVPPPTIPGGGQRVNTGSASAFNGGRCVNTGGAPASHNTSGGQRVNTGKYLDAEVSVLPPVFFLRTSFVGRPSSSSFNTRPPVPSFFCCVGVPVLVRGFSHSPHRFPVVFL